MYKLYLNVYGELHIFWIYILDTTSWIWIALKYFLWFTSSYDAYCMKCRLDQPFLFLDWASYLLLEYWNWVKMWYMTCHNLHFWNDKKQNIVWFLLKVVITPIKVYLFTHIDSRYQMKFKPTWEIEIPKDISTIDYMNRKYRLNTRFLRNNFVYQ